MNKRSSPERQRLKIQGTKLENKSKSMRQGNVHVRDMLRRRPPIGIALVRPLANVAAADAAEEAPFVCVDAIGGGGLASINSFTFRIQVDAIDPLPAM